MEQQQGDTGARKRILLADDHPLVRTGMAALLAGEPDLEVCGESGDLQETARLVETLSPDLVILDLSFADGDALDLIKRLSARLPEVRILVCSMHDESLYADRVLRAGGRGYVSKQEANNRIISAARAVLDGRIYAEGRVHKDLRERNGAMPAGRSDGALRRLSNRELEVFGLIGRGRTTTEIAEQLYLSVKTVETHREKIKKKLGLKTAPELARHAVQWVLQDRVDLDQD